MSPTLSELLLVFTVCATFNLNQSKKKSECDHGLKLNFPNLDHILGLEKLIDWRLCGKS